MGSIPYQRMVMIPDDIDFNFETLVEKLKARFSKEPDRIFTQPTPHQLDMAIEDWHFRIGLNEHPTVIVESTEIADLFAKDHDDKAKIAACKKRLETGGDADPDMNYFNDFVFVLEILEEIRGVYQFDVTDGKLWKNDEAYWEE